MTESELLDELARRTGMSRADVELVMRVLAEIRTEQRRKGEPQTVVPGPGSPPIPRRSPALASGDTPGIEATASAYAPSYTPGQDEVEQLIRDAAKHPLGLQFLVEGNLCAVATLFGVHAFTVDAARQRLEDQGAGA